MGRSNEDLGELLARRTNVVSLTQKLSNNHEPLFFPAEIEI